MRKYLILFSVFLTAACGNQLTLNQGGTPNPGVAYSCPSGTNVMTVTVNGSLCSSGDYSNEPCASVTICQPGSTTNCQTVNNILVDTGSYGLRVFASALSGTVLSSLTETSSGNIAECAEFGTGRTWGEVLQADVYLTSSYYSASLPIQIIDSTYSGGDGQTEINCAGADVSPSAATSHYNGILGIGLLDQDCGSGCTGAHPDTTYYSCNGTSCSGTSCSGGTCADGVSVPVGNQVQNPVPNFHGSPPEVNGLVFLTAGVNQAGVAYDNGCVVFGIGTQANNTPSSGNIYQANVASGAPEITVKLNGTNYATSFLDSGSNGIFLPNGVSLPTCDGDWYCPNSTTNFSFNIGSGPTWNFPIANAAGLFNSGNSVFNDLGGPSGDSSTVDLGVPFFYGNAIWIGINGKATGALSTGNFVGQTGPFWGF